MTELETFKQFCRTYSISCEEEPPEDDGEIPEEATVALKLSSEFHFLFDEDGRYLGRYEVGYSQGWITAFYPRD